MAKLRPLSISHVTNQNADAVFRTAERLGSDGRGRNGLRGYMLYLARDYPVQFIALLSKMTRAELSKRPKRRSRTGNAEWTEERQIGVTDALFDAIERLGSDGKGRGGAVGYFRSIASSRPVQFMKLLSLVLDIQKFRSAHTSKPARDETFTDARRNPSNDFRGEEGQAARDGGSIVKTPVVDACWHAKRIAKFRIVYRPPLVAHSVGGSASKRRTALSRLAAARRS